MANKQKTQQEFLHCLDDLEHAGRRIVLAGDSHPRQMKQFSEALVSRCLRGMVAELRTPDTDTRLRMVKALAQRRGIHLIDAVVQTLASRCQGSVRELEGTLTKLHAMASLTPQLTAAADGDALLGQPQIGHALVHQLFSLERAACTRSAIPFERIFDTVCQKLEVKREDVMGRTRQRHVVLARSLVIHLTRELTSMSYPEIASRMGKGSHSTIVTSAGRLQDQLAMETPTLVAAGPGGDTLPLRELIDRLRYAIEHA
jgi:chromosomal replication initiator protein